MSFKDEINHKLYVHGETEKVRDFANFISSADEPFDLGVIMDAPMNIKEWNEITNWRLKNWGSRMGPYEIEEKFQGYYSVYTFKTSDNPISSKLLVLMSEICSLLLFEYMYEGHMDGKEIKGHMYLKNGEIKEIEC